MPSQDNLLVGRNIVNDDLAMECNIRSLPDVDEAMAFTMLIAVYSTVFFSSHFMDPGTEPL